MQNICFRMWTDWTVKCFYFKTNGSVTKLPVYMSLIMIGEEFNKKKGESVVFCHTGAFEGKSISFWVRYPARPLFFLSAPFNL